MKAASKPVKRALILIFSTVLPFLGIAAHGAVLSANDLLHGCSELLVEAKPTADFQLLTQELEEYHRLAGIVDRDATVENVVALTDAAFEAQLQFTKHFNSRLSRRFEALPMRKSYIGEAARHSVEFLKPWRLGEVGPFPTVNYFSTAEREARRVIVHDGRAYWPDGSLVTDIDHSEFVIGLNGRLYMLKGTDTGSEFRHSSFFSGDPVAAAGTISFSANGRIKKITRSSGHYVPSGQTLKFAVEKIRAMGLFIAPDSVEWRPFNR